MADIFISYAREDRLRVKLLARALEGQTWSVWWDSKIPPGKKFSDVIEEEVSAARCVIVIWSTASVKSDFVQTEAAEGARRKILVPAIIDGVKIPFEFRRIQATDLKDWKGEANHEGFQELIKALTCLLGSPRIQVPIPELPKTEPKESIPAKEHIDKTRQAEPEATEPKDDITKQSRKSRVSNTYFLVALAVVMVVGAIFLFSQGLIQFPSDSLDLPRPNIIILSAREEYDAGVKKILAYKLIVTNWAVYPDDLFKPAPDLPPCGLNKNSSRTWLHIYDALKKQRIYGYCALSAPEDLNAFGFQLEKEKPPPKAVYVILEDRLKGKKYISDTVEIKTDPLSVDGHSK